MRRFTTAKKKDRDLKVGSEDPAVRSLLPVPIVDSQEPIGGVYREALHAALEDREESLSEPFTPHPMRCQIHGCGKLGAAVLELGQFGAIRVCLYHYVACLGTVTAPSVATDPELSKPDV